MKKLLGIGLALLVAAVVVVLWPGSPARTAVVGVVKYRECISPNGSGAVTVALGDSITAGHHVGPLAASDSYFDVLACRDDPPLAYGGNEGVWFETTDEIAARVDDVLAEDPKRVIVLGGTNDVHQSVTGQTVDNLAAIRGRLSAGGADVVVGLLPPSDLYPAETKAVNGDIRAWADAEGVTLVDFWTPLAAPDGTFRDGMTTDGNHPSPAAAEVMADAVAEVLR